MAGNNSVVGLETVTFTDNMSFDGTERGGAMTTNGQLWIGSTVGRHVQLGSITSPSGTVTIGYSSPNITLDVSTGAFIWNDISGAFSPIKENGYFVTGTATGTLPGSPAQGETIQFLVDHASQVLTIKASGTQIIRMGTLASSAGGTALSTAQGDSVQLVYRASDNTWMAIAGLIGTWVMA